MKQEKKELRNKRKISISNIIIIVLLIIIIVILTDRIINQNNSRYIWL